MLHGASQLSAVPASLQAPAGQLTWFSPSVSQKGQRPLGTLDRHRDRVNGAGGVCVVSLPSPDRFVSYGRGGGAEAWAGRRGRRYSASRCRSKGRPFVLLSRETFAGTAA